MPDPTEQASQIIDRIATGTHTDADLAALQHAIDSGQITIATGEKAVALGGDATEAIIVTGDNNIVRVEKHLDVESLRAVLRDFGLDPARNHAEIQFEYFEPETVIVPAGLFLMGSQPAEGIPEAETGQAAINLPAYRIGITPVTNARYAEFIQDTGHPVSPETGWDGKVPPADELNHPVTGIMWLDAIAYCRWLQAITGKQYVLPSEAHWEKAARGTDGRRYPWGNEWDLERCNWNRGTIAAVDQFPAQSIYGCFDMVGNLREWTCSLWGNRRSQPDPQYRYPWKDDARNDENANTQIRRVLRGGAYTDPLTSLTCTARSSCLPGRWGVTDSLSGFRVMLKV